MKTKTKINICNFLSVLCTIIIYAYVTIYVENIRAFLIIAVFFVLAVLFGRYAGIFEERQKYDTGERIKHLDIDIDKLNKIKQDKKNHDI